MPRGKRIDEQKVFELLHQGLSDREIATQLGYASETVRLKRHKFVAKGLIKDKLTKRGRPSKKQALTRIVDIKSDHELALDQAEELLIARFKEAAEVRFLRNRVAALENELKIVKADREELKKFYNDKKEKARQFQLAQQQGEIHPPIGEKDSSLTYHLRCALDKIRHRIHRELDITRCFSFLADIICDKSPIYNPPLNNTIVLRR